MLFYYYVENLCVKIIGGSPCEDACPIYERVMNVNESKVKSNWFGPVLWNSVYFFMDVDLDYLESEIFIRFYMSNKKLIK